MGVVAAEELVDTLARVNDLCVLPYSLAADRERHGGRVAKGLSHFIYNRGYPLEILLGSYHLYVKALAEDLGCAARKLRFVKAGFLIADGVCSRGVARSQKI